jgi:hypothetical protein
VVLTSLDHLCFRIELMTFYVSKEEVTGKSGTVVLLLGCREMDDWWGAIDMWIDNVTNI